LYTVARRIVIDDWRSARIRPEVITDELPEPRSTGITDVVGDQTVDRELVVAALRTLSPEHRDVILECYFRGSSVAEAAQTLGIPPGTVKSRTHYALRALRLALEEMGGRP
jgi:RNA polymerase sigma-70 factor (ECF subfamily)